MSDKLVLSVSVIVICMITVVLVLIGLIYIIRIQKIVLANFSGNKGKKTELKAQVSQNNTIDIIEIKDDGELIAVISAAVAAFMGRQVSTIKVRSIKNMQPCTSSWNRAGRQDQINSRF